MATMYYTRRGETYTPVQVEVWGPGDSVPRWELQEIESLEATWEVSGAGTATVVARVTDSVRQLLDVTSESLLVIRYNGSRHVSTVVQAEVRQDGADGVQVVKLVTASPWSLLDGVVIPPEPGRSPAQQGHTQVYSVGPAPQGTLAAQIVNAAAERLGLPFLPMVDNALGQSRTVTGKNSTAGELLRRVCEGSRMWLRLSPVLPGDTVRDWQGTVESPKVLAAFEEFRSLPDFTLYADGGDLEEWSMKRRRAEATRVWVTNGKDGEDAEFAQAVAEDEPPVGWARREVSVEEGDEGADLVEVAEQSMSSMRAVTEFSATMSPSTIWEFGEDNVNSHQFTVGDIATVVIPSIGNIPLVVASIKLELDQQNLTVTPELATPESVNKARR